MEEAVAVDCLKPLVPQDVLTPVLLLQLGHHHVDVVDDGDSDVDDVDDDCMMIMTV